MTGPEGQLFGPMADTYAFALGGALMLALMVAPVLSMLLFKHLKPSHDNGLVRWLKRTYLQQLGWFLDHRLTTLGIFAVLIGATALVAVPRIGREFMPELEEGNLWIRGTFPLNTSLTNTARDCQVARSIMGSYPEVATIVAEIGRPDDGTDPTGFYNAEFFVPLLPEKECLRRRRAARMAALGLRPETSAVMKAEYGQTDERRPGPRFARRGLELLAEHPRQRHGGAFGRQRGQLDQDLRSRFEEIRRARAEGPRAAQGSAWHPECRHLQHQRANEPRVSNRSRQVSEIRRERRGREQHAAIGHRRQGFLVDDRGRTHLRHFDAFAPATPAKRGRHPGLADRPRQ